MAISDRAEMAERRASSSQTVDIFVALLYNSPCQIKYRWQARVQQHPEALLQVHNHPYTAGFGANGPLIIPRRSALHKPICRAGLVVLRGFLFAQPGRFPGANRIP